MSKIALRALMTALTVAILLPLAASAHDAPAIPLDSAGLPAWEIKEWTDFPVEIQLRDLDHLKQMLNEAPIAHFHREHLGVNFDENGKVTSYLVDTRVTESEFDVLEAAGYAPLRTFDHERKFREWNEQVWADRAAGKSRDDLKTDPLNYVPLNDEIGTMLQGIAATYPTLARYFTWGTSVDGRTLHGIVISDNVQTHEAEPEVRYSSTMHGDEIPGLVNTINMAYYLCEHYNQPGYEDATDLVNNFELHMMPDYNPDGTIAHQRYNSNGVDLNRNFDLPDGTHTVLEIENQYFKDHANAHHFVVSSNLHSGALVMNYPWDYTYTLAPDDAACIRLSLEYSTRNLPMYNGSFSQGITNGAQWYVVTGSLQDWVYDQTDCIDVTGELCNTKWPSNSTLQGLWDDNRDAMIAYARSALYGAIHGIVTDVNTGNALDATVSIVGNSMVTHTDPAHGDYYKLADDGTFDLMFEANGYVTQTITGVSHTWGVGTTLDVQMHPLATGHVSGTVHDNSGAGLDAFVELRTWPGGEIVDSASCSADAGGAYSFDVFYGDYTLTASAADHFVETQSVTVSATPAVVDFVLGGMLTLYPVDEDFEAGSGSFTGDWIVATPGYNSDSCLTDSEGTYPNNAELIADAGTAVDLTGVMDPIVSFRAKWSIENFWDAVFFEVSTDAGASWTPLSIPGHTGPASGQGAQVPRYAPCFDDNQATWVSCVADLSEYIGQSDVRFRFRLVTDTSQYYDGFYVDNFKVTVIIEGGMSSAPATPALAAGVKAYPNPFNPKTTVMMTNPMQGRVSVNVYNLRGGLVRSLVDEDLPKGVHEVSWDGVDDRGREVQSGVYFARMVTADGEAFGAKLVLVK